MGRCATCATLILSLSASAAGERVEVTISNANIGNLILELPAEWRSEQREDELNGASVLEVSTGKEDFRLVLQVSYAGNDIPDATHDLDERVAARLGGYMDYRMPEFVENSAEGDFSVRRFGPRNHGLYSRVTIPERGDQPFTHLTHGARIVGNAFITFTLYDSDPAARRLEDALAVVTSARPDTEIADVSGAYACRSEHRIGFEGRNAVWIPAPADVVDQQYVVRTSADGDRFAASSTWVFVEAGRMRASSWCDNERAAQGVFECHGPGDEEFRMDTGTLRFIYVQLEGYYEVAEGEVLDRDQETPYMDIGVCARTD
ncbi:MAG: hypothetical protein ACREQZ_08990 [Woeseiaceae bacterium]